MSFVGQRKYEFSATRRFFVLVFLSSSLLGSAPQSYCAELSGETGDIEIYMDGAESSASPMEKSRAFFAEPMSHPEEKTRLFCVRTCDGFYFPLDLPRDSSSPADANSACRSLCPGAEVLTYYQDGNSDFIEKAKTLDLEDYASLKNANRYRSNLNAACGCRRPPDLKQSILTDPTLRRGDIVATSQGLVMFHGFENTNQLEKNFSSVRSVPVPLQFEAEIRNIDRQYPDPSAQSNRVQILDDVSKSTNDRIHFVDGP